MPQSKFTHRECVDSVECPQCLFTFANIHEDSGKPGCYTCPCCGFTDTPFDEFTIEGVPRKGMQ